MKRILAMLLAAGMLLSAMPTLAEETSAAENAVKTYPAEEYTFSGEYVKQKANPGHKFDPKVLDGLSRQHPRLFFTEESFADLKSDVAEGQPLNEKWARFLRTMDKSVEAGPPEWYESDNAEENWIRDVGDDLAGISLAYVITEDKKYLESVEDFIYALCVQYPHWGRPGTSYNNNGLACAHASRGLAVAYDWLFEDLS